MGKQAFLKQLPPYDHRIRRESGPSSPGREIRNMLYDIDFYCEIPAWPYAYCGLFFPCGGGGQDTGTRRDAATAS